MYFTPKKQAGDGYQGNDRDVSDSMLSFSLGAQLATSARLCFMLFLSIVWIYVLAGSENRAWFRKYPGL